ncbi:hypothetical protein PRIPAC_89850 [Pristionchus pacificus]|uniref:Uncharacterized protein n=1 Tax=Pristionchus pacificus TaxID=54126 RepID=A0A2A6CVI5_PRIPA|nr:hypothetical protein PRIPAC_89850 [Pristionchus pacificus]|eukprot:PDM82086.1 hypothetical protein PRIPAC_36479 [Pristionchus pacificus]
MSTTACYNQAWINCVYGTWLYLREITWTSTSRPEASLLLFAFRTRDQRSTFHSLSHFKFRCRKRKSLISLTFRIRTLSE